MNEMTLVEHPEFGSMRCYMYEGKPWFVGREAAQRMGYTNPNKAVRDHVPARHRRGNDSFTPSELVELDPQTILISEAGLYRLIMRSNMPEAERFTDWVTEELLPSVRQDGYYVSSSITQEQFEQLKGELEAVDHVNGLLFGDYHNEKTKVRILSDQNKRLRWRYTLATGEQLN